MKAAKTLILIMISCMSLHAQNFIAEISSDTIPIGNYVELIIKIENLEGEFEAPELSEFNIVSGPNMSSSVQITNGSMTSSKEYSYYIKPEEIGTFIIEPASLITHEKRWQTKELTIHVVPNPDNITILPKQRKSIFFDGTPFPGQEEKYNQKKSSEKKLKRL